MRRSYKNVYRATVPRTAKNNINHRYPFLPKDLFGCIVRSSSKGFCTVVACVDGPVFSYGGMYGRSDPAIPYSDFPCSRRGNVPTVPRAWDMKILFKGFTLLTATSPRSRARRIGAISFENSRVSVSQTAIRVALSKLPPLCVPVQCTV